MLTLKEIEKARNEHIGAKFMQETHNIHPFVAGILDMIHIHNTESTLRRSDGLRYYTCHRCNRLVGANGYRDNGSPADLSI